MNEIEKKELERIKRSVNPKTKVRRVSRIEEDGSKTTAHVLDFGDRAVFHDEDGARIDELTTTTMRGQTLAAGDFDIDLGRTDRLESWRIKENNKFRQWLTDNGFDPDDKSLTIGHPKIGQIDLIRSFGTLDHSLIWRKFYAYPDVYSIKTNNHSTVFDYKWSDKDYMHQQIEILRPGYIYTETHNGI
jgi:hypothetical protein